MTNNSCLFFGLMSLGIAVSAAFGQDIEWVQPTRGVSIAVDAADNVYTVDYEYALGAEMIVTKRDACGDFIWEALFDQNDPTRWERASWIATDNDGNVVVCGTSMSGFSNPVEAASIIVKFDPDGNLLWRNVFENSFDSSSTKKCLIDGDNNIYVLGMGIGPAGYVAKVKKFAPDGATMWSYFDSAGIGRSVNFKFTPDGFITITGRSIIGSVNGYAKIDLNGNVVWSYPGVSSLTVGDCDGDAFGNTYLVHGEFVTNGGTVVKKIGPSGALIWENVYEIAGLRIEVGSDNQAVVSGFPNANSGGAAFIKVNEDGGLIWSNLDADGPQMLLLHAQLLLDGANNAYLAAGTLFEMAVCRVNSDGTSAWTQTVPGGSGSNAIVLANNDNSVFMVGGTTARISQGAVNCHGNVTPKSFQVTRGTYASGAIGDLAASDDSDFSIRRAVNDIQPKTEFEVKSISPFANPGSLEFTLEGAVFARSEVTQTIELYDYIAGAWELLDSRNANRFSDTTVIVTATGNLSRFVEAGTMCIEARICYRSTNPRQQFSSNTDLTAWTVSQ
jgi:hypothetical protein